jgi:hypothetical protein
MRVVTTLASLLYLSHTTSQIYIRCGKTTVSDVLAQAVLKFDGLMCSCQLLFVFIVFTSALCYGSCSRTSDMSRLDAECLGSYLSTKDC